MSDPSATPRVETVEAMEAVRTRGLLDYMAGRVPPLVRQLERMGPLCSARWENPEGDEEHCGLTMFHAGDHRASWAAPSEPPSDPEPTTGERFIETLHRTGASPFVIKAAEAAVKAREAEPKASE